MTAPVATRPGEGQLTLPQPELDAAISAAAAVETALAANAEQPARQEPCTVDKFKSGTVSGMAKHLQRGYRWLVFLGTGVEGPTDTLPASASFDRVLRVAEQGILGTRVRTMCAKNVVDMLRQGRGCDVEVVVLNGGFTLEMGTKVRRRCSWAWAKHRFSQAVSTCDEHDCILYRSAKKWTLSRLLYRGRQVLLRTRRRCLQQSSYRSSTVAGPSKTHLSAPRQLFVGLGQMKPILRVLGFPPQRQDRGGVNRACHKSMGAVQVRGGSNQGLACGCRFVGTPRLLNKLASMSSEVCGA